MAKLKAFEDYSVTFYINNKILEYFKFKALADDTVKMK